ncbi:MAG: nicotinamide riboside transporter PnuC [Bacteroidota bacterium]|nr:nicotinamide riboside transporter PnuC [Bacteroidota bacterium]
MLTWIQNNFIEFFGVVTGLVYIFFSIRQNIWLWPLGIATSALYIVVFLKARLYADMGLQVYYLLVSLYGWYHWIYGAKEQHREELPVISTSLQMGLRLVGAGMLMYWPIYFILIKLHSSLPIFDAFTFVTSIVATWMLARKYIEQWWIWVVTDAIYIGMYIVKGLYLTTALYALYTILAVIGYYEWKKKMKTESALP